MSKFKRTVTREDKIKIVVAEHEIKRILGIPQKYRFSNVNVDYDFVSKGKYAGRPIMAFYATNMKEK